MIKNIKKSKAMLKWWNKNKDTKKVKNRNNKIKETISKKYNDGTAKFGFKKGNKYCIEREPWNKNLTGKKLKKFYVNGFSGGPKIGHIVTIKTKKKMSKIKKDLFISGKLNSKKTKKTIRKLRISALKNVEKLGGPSKGKHETQILDKLEKLYGYKIDRTFRPIGYKVDGYIPELNICIEVDESHHFDFNGNLKKEDIERQKLIEKELNCNFLRVMDI